ncbi:MAG: tetratricopeptide repeat protein [Flavobacteriales bacterium]|nr:tetratricopeptide repeat protein [Flavobacteriales bacterium]
MKTIISLLILLALPCYSFSQKQYENDIKKIEIEIENLLKKLQSNLDGYYFTFQQDKTSGKAFCKFSYITNSFKPSIEITYYAEKNSKVVGADTYKFNLLDIDMSKMKIEKNNQWNSFDLNMLLKSSGTHNTFSETYFSNTKKINNCFIRLENEKKAEEIGEILKTVILKCNSRSELILSKKQQQEKDKQTILDKNKAEYKALNSEIEKLLSEGNSQIKSANYESALIILNEASTKLGEAYMKISEGNKPFQPFANELVETGREVNTSIDVAETRNEIVNLNKEINNSPKNFQNYLSRGKKRVYLLYYYSEFTTREDSIIAFADFSKVNELKPKNDLAYYFLGYLKGVVFTDFEGALNEFNSAIKINPKNADAYLHRAGVRGQLGDIKGEKSDLDKYKELEPFEKEGH